MTTLDTFGDVIRSTVRKLDQKAGNLNNDEVGRLAILMDIFLKYNEENKVAQEEKERVDYIKARDEYERMNGLII